MLDPSAAGGVPLELTGRETDAALPGVLLGAARAPGGGAEDIFLPAGYLVPTRTFDVGPAARGAAGALRQSHEADADEVIVLELADGATLVTSAGRLRAALRLAHPELLDGDTILLEKLRASAAAPGRGWGEALGGVISKVYLLAAGKVPDAILDAALGQLKDKAELGVSWFGTRVLMRAIEERLEQKPGLYRWSGARGNAADLQPAQLVDANDGAQSDPARNPMLVFVHGTGSSTLGSFGDLRTGERDLWGMLQARFGERIFGFEHRTLSESPIENAIELVRALPRGAHVSFASHSRGGLVVDLLCLDDFDALIDDYSYAFPGTGASDAAESARVRGELDEAHKAQRDQLRALAQLMRERKLVIGRYVRLASPANGTLLASGNFDVFLSGLLTLIGAVPFFFGSPLYSAFKRVVIEIAKNRTDAHLVPGIEAMLPDSPMARLLRDAPVQSGVAMAVIAGDIEGGNMLTRLGVLLTDFLLFDKEDNDLVVNTSSMLAGIAPRAGSRVLFERGANVSHFRYFTNIDTRTALRDWFTSDAPAQLGSFRALPEAAEYSAALASAARSREAGAPNRPVVVILPGVMGSHLSLEGKQRVWFDALAIAGGGLGRIAWDQRGVGAEELFEISYGKICAHLSASHRVERFPYDWRQPLDVLAERLGEFLDQLMKQTDAPIRLLAHSAGGLVVRSCIGQRRPVMDALMARDGARLVMLGTPNQGTHTMVANLIGKAGTLRTLARIDLTHDLQQVLDIVAGFRGALQLLPKPGFTDTFQGQHGGGAWYDYQDAQTWIALKEKMTDFWFGDRHCGTPGQAALDSAAWLWTADGNARPALPAAYEKKSVYVFGVARNTVCGVREETDGNGRVRVKMVGTARGDGSVTWDSGRIDGIGSYYYLPAQHGDLPWVAEYFPALTELLTTGATALLSGQPPVPRTVEQALPLSYDAGPPTAADPEALQRELVGASQLIPAPARSRRRLAVSVKAMDLRYLAKPIMVGHYEQDAIAGAEALIDRELLAGDLSKRYNLGLYAGPRGTSTVVLRGPAGPGQRRARLTGAVVTGLGRYEGALSAADLTDAVRTGGLRYLLQIVDVLGKDEREVPLATLLLGFNSSANLTVAASVEALVRGVMEANDKFYEITRLNIHIAQLDIVELYLDTAITAVYALRQLSERLAAQADKHGATLVTASELVRGEGMRQRLFDASVSNYWPRLIITNADREDESGRTECGQDQGAATVVADRLRFLYVGQRARAETVVQQRQPGLIEALVRQQIHDATWNEDFGRMLFQLMIPHDFKDAARQLDRLVLVVDSQSANLPWELMLADQPGAGDGELRARDERRPLALRAAVVRQLSSTRFRPQVEKAIAHHALVIGNPSVTGFGAAFHDSGALPGQPDAEPPSLPGAQKEATAAAAVLTSMGYTVQSVIGADQPASRVLAALYRQPWRILHIAAHGVFDLRHADGRRRSGVLLSDGLLITAAEIAAMEIVPDLVFLNCCHLGQIDSGRSSNKLAASVARELIEIGVRCVLVAGWAVNDESAVRFSQSFYEQLLLRRLPFGDAVFEARKTTWDANRLDITWGAFQAYGDPGWTAELRPDEAPGSPGVGQYASPEEVLDELARTRVSLSRLRAGGDHYDRHALADSVATMIRQRCPPGWQNLPQLHSALGMTWFELDELELARTEFLAAIGSEDEFGVVPIHDIEQLAHAEILLGERSARRAISASEHDDVAAREAEAMIDLALKRLEGLDALVGAAPDAAPQYGVNAMRSALRGSAWRSKASLRARQLLFAGLAPADSGAARAALVLCLGNAVKAYRSAEGSPGSSHFAPRLALNRLALDALTEWDDDTSRNAALALARYCGQLTERETMVDHGMWNVMTQPQALLVEHLILGSLGRADDAGQLVFEEIARAYAEATNSTTLKPVEIDSIVTELDSIALFCEALAQDPCDEAMARTAHRLRELAQRLQPSHAEPIDQPCQRQHDTAGAGAARAASREPAANPNPHI